MTKNLNTKNTFEVEIFGIYLEFVILDLGFNVMVHPIYTLLAIYCFQ